MMAMSGGVDSSVAAALLCEQGYDVKGVTLKLFSNEDIGLDSKPRTCCSLADVEDARCVARKLGFEHYVFNFGMEFQREVIQRFASGYLEGLTPNPCINCNWYIKLHKLLERAELMDMDFLATGHYARVEYDGRLGRTLLKKAKDSTKDQSYVLYAMTQRELEKTKFPLGNLIKSEVRTLAEERGLVNARKHDSQDICFVKDGDYGQFLEQVLGVQSEPGNFVDQKGQILGQHRGLNHYTVGQRKGLGLSFGDRKYVLRKDKASNTITLGDRDALSCTSFIAADVNLISVEKLEIPLEVKVKTRYKQAEVPAVISPMKNNWVRVDFLIPQPTAAPGQAVVFYQGDIVVGGGMILPESESVACRLTI